VPALFQALPAPAPQVQTPQPPLSPLSPLPAAGPLPATADIGALTAQLADLSVQQAGLKAQWDGLRRQLDNMLQTNPARPGVQQEWANVGSQRAQVEGQIAALRARIAQKQGAVPGVPGTQDNPPFPRPGPDPDLAVAGGIAIMLALILPLSIAYAIRMLRRNPAPKGPRTEDFTPRFDRLEQAVDAIAIEVERVSEGQRFVTKILAERPAERAAEPLAIGAGPAEQIRVQDREGVRQNR
jgi:hypothetical protein